MDYGVKVLYQAIVTIMTLLFASGCSNQSIKDYLTSIHEEGKLNGVVLVGTSNEVIFSDAFGYSDYTQQTLLSTEHRFQIGSIYKEFPGVAVMQLFEDNKLALDVPISRYLFDFPPWSKDITIKNLLSYSSGLPKVQWSKQFQNEAPVSMNSIIQELMEIDTLEFSPGENYLYSNFNPILLIKIVEAVSGMTFEDYSTQYLLKPANMQTAVFAKSYPYKNIDFLASPFNSEFEPDDFKFSASEMLLNVSALDLYNWLLYLHSNEALTLKSLSLLSESAGTQAPLGVVEWKGDSIYHHHHGSSGNFEAVIRYVSEQDLFIVILTNQKNSNVFDIADKLASIQR